ncbi:unnamed protein product [Microthlaspi erraticum]|uniref:Uncharacterized protein n=1 Tax=Microthlaspi erraticum TaxID=1685480 RepID=A0A6D2JMF3_9BRAS|nr:unnamed protein product [Microthlaspi erraticum]
MVLLGQFNLKQKKNVIAAVQKEKAEKKVPKCQSRFQFPQAELRYTLQLLMGATLTCSTRRKSTLIRCVSVPLLSTLECHY